MRVPTLVLTGAVSLLPAAALAHEGHLHEGLLAGLMHPVGGIDHLLVTLGLGLVAGLAATRSSTRAPVRTAPAAGTALAVTLGLLAGVSWVLLGAPGDAASLHGWSVLLEQAVVFGLLAVALLVLAADRLGARGLGIAALLICIPHGALHAIESTGGSFYVGLAAASAGLFALGAIAGRRVGVLSRGPAARLRWALAGGFAAAFAGLASLAMR